MGYLPSQPLFWPKAADTPVPDDWSCLVRYSGLPVFYKCVTFQDTLVIPFLTLFTEARHACDQGDGLDGYTWTQFDPREGGIQVVKDSHNNVKVTTELLKVAGGEHGGSWAARIRGEPIIQGLGIPTCSPCLR